MNFNAELVRITSTAAPAWVSLAAGLAMLVPWAGLVPPRAFNERINYASLFYVAGVMGVGAVMAHTGLGRALGATGEALYPVAVAVSAATTLATPWLLRASAPVARFVDRALPQPLQTFAALYGSWLEELRGCQDATQISAPVDGTIMSISAQVGSWVALALTPAGAISAERQGRRSCTSAPRTSLVPQATARPSATA